MMSVFSRLKVRVSTRRCLQAFGTKRHQHTLNLRGAPVDFHPEVLHALNTNQPVVALETALVSCGLPFPLSLEVPQALEDIVRSTGAIPATIGIINGRVKIGLEKAELYRIADRSHNPAKISRRDIAAAIAGKRDGGTTCSATLVFAALAGIKVFATGGLGGVHRGGETSFDISADLHELTRCPVGLVSSGVKSILDIPRTLEYLETLGVPVITYGDTNEFPAFFSRHSGCKVPWNINNPSTAAEFLFVQHQLGMNNGALIAVPIPESYEAEGQKIQEIVDIAIQESEKNGVSKSGKDVTPWLLDRIAELSEGASLTSNVALLENTALVGGQIAVQYQLLANLGKAQGVTYAPPRSPPTTTPAPESVKLRDPINSENVQSPVDVVVVGSAALDITAQELFGTQSALAVHSTAPGHVKLSLGGVARNVAEALHRVMGQKFPGLSSVLVAPVGNDAFGHIMVEEMAQAGMRIDGLIRSENRSAVCNMVLDSKGALIGGIADMSIMQTLSGSSIVKQLERYQPRIVALDANAESKTIQETVWYCHQNQIKVLFEPTSAIKSTAIIPAIMSLQGTGSDPRVTFCMPNLLELDQILETLQSDEYDLTNNERWWTTINSLNLGSSFRTDLEKLSRLPVSSLRPGEGSLAFLMTDGVVQKAIHLLPLFQNLIIKCGDKGVVVAMLLSPNDTAKSLWREQRSNIKDRCVISRGNEGEMLVLQHFPPMAVDNLINVTGAGDSFVGAFLANLAHNPDMTSDPSQLQGAIHMAQKAACLTLQSHAAVSPMLSSIDAL